LLNKASLLGLSIAFPDRRKQEKFAKVSGDDRYCISQLRRKHKLLQTYKRGVMQKSIMID
jgi:hypothetical protein